MNMTRLTPMRATSLSACLLAAASPATIALATFEPEAKPAQTAAPAKEQAKPDATTPSPAPDPNVSRDVSQYNIEKGKPAASGYDVVAYFGPDGDGKRGEAKKGDERFAYTFRGIKYLFSSKKNLDLFASAPARFEPSYGGWCAYAMADGKKVEIDPKSFLVSDGRLFLFYKDFFNDTRSKWVKKEPELNPKADKSWKKISGEDPPSDDDKKCPLCPDKK